MTAPTSPLLTPREAARYLRRSERWLRKRRAELGAVVSGNSHPLYPLAGLDAWIARNAAQPPADPTPSTQPVPPVGRHIDLRGLPTLNPIDGKPWGFGVAR